MKKVGDIVEFVKQRDYVMVNPKLGRGSFGKTVLLNDPFIDELFVAKKYEPDVNTLDEKEKYYRNFLDEIKIMHKLNHRNIVRIFNYYAYEKISTGFILMEYIDGTDISNYILVEYTDINSPFEQISLDDLFKQLIDGFHYIETHGIIHRDIREGNIMVDKNGTVKIIDFGIGKVIQKNDSLTDSLADEINRAGSDTLPQEYYDGDYTSKTDMFYLGELLNRLIKSADEIDITEFSFFNVLEKMMMKKPVDRYNSFSEIVKTIEQHDFVNLGITQHDREIYQNFTNSLFRMLNSFLDECKMSNEVKYFTSQLEKVLQVNCFENEIQDNRDIIRCVVTGGYRYNRTPLMSCNVAQAFLEWFKKSSQQSQQLILNNIISKLSAIGVKESEPELPF